MTIWLTAMCSYAREQSREKIGSVPVILLRTILQIIKVKSSKITVTSELIEIFNNFLQASFFNLFGLCTCILPLCAVLFLIHYSRVGRVQSGCSDCVYCASGSYKP
ncbi:hypothetical protein M0804_008817 [Polistes exclamans]|nr:hypothetical protein M0804_008817 [Polistes exclamans]